MCIAFDTVDYDFGAKCVDWIAYCLNHGFSRIIRMARIMSSLGVRQNQD